MKIPGYLNIKVNDAYLNQNRIKQDKEAQNVHADPGSPKAKKDEIILSPRASEIRNFEGTAKSVPETRQEKIEAVKGQISSGNYDVKGTLVARKIVDLIS